MSADEVAEFLDSQTANHSAFLARKLYRNRFAALLSPEAILQEAWIAAFRDIATFVASDARSLDRWIQTVLQRKLWDALTHAKALKRGGNAIRENPSGNPSSSCLDLLNIIHKDQRTASSVVGAREAETMVRSLWADSPCSIVTPSPCTISKNALTRRLRCASVSPGAARLRIEREIKMLREQVA